MKQNPDTSQNSLWYPYVQMSQLESPGNVVRAQGVHFELEDGSRLIDAISSWWCVIHGYSHPEINEAARDQIDTLSHVMMGGLSHPWSRKLADKLVEISPQGLNHVFFADSGSVGVEVALKVALQYWHNLENSSKRQFVCLRNGYHGDTFGAMSVGEPDDAMQIAFPELLMKPHFVHPPGFEKPTLPNSDLHESDASSQAGGVTLSQAIAEVRQLFADKHRELAAFICEPIMQGYGGFHLYEPEYLQVVRELCDQYDVLFIVDEVATGLGRTGKMFAVDHAEVAPDIMVVSKALTAGYVGMSATLASTKVFESFWSDDPSKAFMHGPTFMGNALASRIALKSIEILERDWQRDFTQGRSHQSFNTVARVEAQLQAALDDFKHPWVKSTRVLGAMGVIEVHDVSHVEGLAVWARERGVWLRPIGPYVYTMPAFNISEEELAQVIDCMKAWFVLRNQD